MRKAIWISSPVSGGVPCFKKSFSVNKKLIKAYIDVSAMGFYDVKINGKSITSTIFNPGWTSVTKRVQYQRYNILDLLKEENEMEILLGEGWGGAERLGWDGPDRPFFSPSLIFEVTLIDDDGMKEYISSDDSIDVYSSYIVKSSIYDGETQDKNLEIKYLGKAKFIHVPTTIIHKVGEDIVEGERIYPLKMFNDNNGDRIIDFGQNFTGYVEVSFKGKKGEVISFTPGEMLDKYGNFYNKNYRSAKSFYSFTFTGEFDTFKPLFSFMGGRYIKLIEYPNDIKFDSFVGIMVHSNIKRTGYFHSGNEKINQLYHNIIYGQLSNYLDVPTDCPQRDERLGWLGDAQVFCKAAAINFNVLKFFTKWLKDVELDQHKDGGIEGVCPKIHGLDVMVACGWADAATIIPYEMYLSYEDTEVLKESFPMMKKWLEYVESRGSNRYLWLGDNHFGDWLALDAPYGESVGATNLDYLASAFYAYSTSILINVGKIIGEDVSYYEDLYKNIKKEFLKEFFIDGLPKGEKAVLGKTKQKTCYTQTAIAIALQFGLYEECNKEKLLNALTSLIDEADGRMTTGFLGTPYILHVLSDNGRSDYAYNLLFQEKNPSWLFSVNHGATTMWEHYDGINENGDFWSEAMNSFNHYAYGAVYDWIFANTLGIRRILPGYKKVEIRPIVDKRLGFASGSIETRYGKLASSWYYQDDHIVFEVDVPNQIEAIFVDNLGKRITLNKGKNRLYRIL